MDGLDLLAVPGMDVVLQFAPFFWGALWLLVTVSLWRGGFNDLIEQLTRPRWSGAERARALLMLPIRAVLLAFVAGFAAAATTFGLGVQIGIVLMVINVIRGGELPL
ncbi:hypothetical protein RMQ97_02760 [Maricaulis sp. D1M11]|uniref:hypothetical protein n=1 Tax=Maricaulis sp. D1M11 TaxID=3076117 RepID=UPI0039B3F5D0